MYCPNCGTSNVDNARFCKSCGTPLEMPLMEDLPVDQVPEPEQVSPSYYYLNEQTRPQSSSFETRSNQGRPRKKTVVLAVIGGLVILVGVVVGLLFLSNRDPLRADFADGAYYHRIADSDFSEDEEQGVRYSEDCIVVHATPIATKDQVSEVMEKYDATLVGELPKSNAYQYRLSMPRSYSEIKKLTSDLSDYRCVESATPITSGSLDYMPSLTDELIPSTGDGEDEDALKTWGLTAIKAEAAWKELGSDAPGSSVGVGIIDTQFFAGHEDLQDAFVDMNQSYQDGFSAWYNSPAYFASEQWKSDKTYDASIDKDDTGGTYGTHVAGIIGARNNDVGVSGVAYGASLYGWQGGFGVADRAANGSEKTTAGLDWSCALEWLVGECGCKVVNVSVAHRNAGEVSKEERENYAKQVESTINALVANGHEFVVVVAAGDDPKADASLSSVFAAVQDEQAKSRIIVVGSLSMADDGSYGVSANSSGGDRVDVLAPGGNIWNASYDVDKTSREAVGTYEYGSGTSMATPMVSGVAALAFQANSELTGAQVKSIICDKTDGAKMYAGVDGNATPKRRLVDAEETVKIARKTEGEAGHAAAAAIASSFVTVWYDDFSVEQAGDGDATYAVATTGEYAYPNRLVPMIEEGSDAQKSFSDELEFPKDGWTTTSKNAVAKFAKSEDDRDVFEVAVTFATTTKESLSKEERQELLKSTSEAVWEVGVNADSGKVVSVVEVSGYETPAEREAREKKEAEEKRLEEERRRKEEEERKRQEEERRRQEEEERQRQEEEERQRQEEQARILSQINGYYERMGSMQTMYIYVHDGVLEYRYIDGGEPEPQTYTYAEYYPDGIPALPGHPAWMYPELSLVYFEGDGATRGTLGHTNADGTNYTGTGMYLPVEESEVPDWVKMGY